MLNKIQKRFALSEKGAKDFRKGVIYTTLLNISLMLPALYIYFFLKDYLKPITNPGQVGAHSILYYITGGIIFMLIMWIIARLQYRSTFTTVYDESATRRISLAEKLRKLPLAFFGEKNLSDLTSTIMDDSTQLEHTFSHAVPQLFASLISIFLISIGLMFYNWQMTIALLWVVPIAGLVIFIAKKKMRDGNQDIYDNKRVVTDHIQEGLETIQEIKSYNIQHEYLSELRSKLKTFEKHLTKSELLSGAFVNTSQSILKLGLASVIITGSILLSTSSIDLFTYLIFLVIASRIYDPINDVFNNLAALFYLDIRINRMNEMESLPIQKGATRFQLLHYDIEFKNVDFSYEDGKQVLNNISFTAKQGEITALVGPSGGGKSTAAKLAARFWDIESGTITVGGQDISKIDPEILLEHYSIVFQDVVLFNTSVMENIRIGNRNASDEEVLHAASLACCDDFVNKMPNGYNTVIGENGETLSGGERQRISIARALLKNAPIVLLDEATASLDVENETKIQTGISELVRDKTVLIIAHRMRTVASADKIIVIKDGSVAESGNPEGLKYINGEYSKMLKRQMETA